MNGWPWIGGLLAGLAGLCFYCVPHDVQHIEHDIMARSAKALINANVVIPTRDSVAVDGRDVTLTGPAGSALISDASRDMVASLRGVRTVKVIATEPPPALMPVPLPVEAQKVEEDLTTFLEGKTIRFDISSDVIHPEGRLVLDQVFRILTTAPTVAVDITGHTDNDGDPNFNLDLSRRRAAAVKKYLVARGIKAQRIETEGFGSTKPLVPNDSPINMAKNRRIEFHASGRIGPIQ